MITHKHTYSILSLIITVTMGLSLVAIPNKTSQAMAAGISDYFIPTSTQQIWDIFVANDNDPNPIDVAQGLRYVIGLTAYMDNTVVYYDHWENGYGFNPANFTGADEVYNANQGQVLSFVSYNVPISRSAAPDETIAECGALSSNPGGYTTNCYDGRDHLYVTGGVAATLTVWPESIGTANALSWGLFPTKPYQTSYIISVGENLADNAPYYTDFSNTYVIVQSTADDNTVTIDDPETAGVEVTVDLNKGEVTQLHNIWSGTEVSADYPVQTLYIAGETRSDNGRELRGYTSIPTSMWSNEYFNPVSGRTGGNGTDLYIYNPDGAQTIDWQDSSGSGSFTIGAGATLAYSDPSSANHKVPADSAVILTGTNNINVIGAADTEGGSYEWGFNLVPSNLLASEYYVGWAPGTSDASPSNNCSPVWITATQDNTSVSVDYGPANGSYDVTYNIDRLESVRIYDPDHVNTGMNLIASAPIAAAWGEAGLDEHGTACVATAPNMDLGYTVVPYIDDFVDVALNLNKTANPTLILDQAGQTAEFTLTVSTDMLATNAVDVVDTLPANWSFVNDSATITFPDSSQWTGNAADPTSIVGQVLTWDLNVNMLAHNTLTIVFDAITTAAPGGISINKATATGGIGSRTFTAMDKASVNVSNIQVAKDSNVSGLVEQGDSIIYTLTLTNGGLLPLTNVIARDPLPAGTTYVPNSTTATGYFQGTYLDQFGSASYSISNGTFPWGSSWSESGIESGGNPSAGRIQVTGGKLQFRDSPALGGDYTLTRDANLSGTTHAHLTFSYQEGGDLEIEDHFHVEVYYESSWHTILTVSDDFTGPLTANYDISEYANANSQIRIMANGYSGYNEYLYIDNVGIDFDRPTTKDNISGGTYLDLVNGIPGNLVVTGDAFNIPVGHSMTVTYHVQVNNPLEFGLMGIENEAYASNSAYPFESSSTVIDPLDVIDVSLDGSISDDTPDYGAVVTFTHRIANRAGFQTANNLTITDIVPTGYTYVPGSILGGTSRNDSSPAGTGLTWTIASLAANSYVDLTYQATVLQTGSYDNYAEITSYNQYDFDSRAGNGQQTPDEDDDDTVSITVTSELNVTTATDVSAVDGAGDVIHYTVSVENTGTISLSGVTATDPDVTLTYQSGDTDLDGKLDVGETWVYTGSYTVSQAEMDAGGVIHSEVTADSSESPADTFGKDVTITQTPLINATTATDVSVVDDAGDVIHYTVSVENTGTISLSGITATDPDVTLTYQSGDTDLDGKLDVGETWVYTGSYTVSQAEMDTGGVVHSEVTADSSESPADIFEKDVTITQNPDILVTMTSDVPDVDEAGDVITYTVTVENTGNVTQTGISLDGNPDLTFTRISGDTDSDGFLDINETWVYRATYTVTQEDVNSGGPIHSEVTVDTDQADPETATEDVAIANTAPTVVEDVYGLHWSNTSGLDVDDVDGVLANDSDANSNPMSVELVTDVTHGELVLNADGSFTYVPTGGYVGPSDAFTYRAYDGLLYSDPVNVTINFTNTVPSGVVDEYTTLWRHVLTVDAPQGVLVNDSDPDGDPYQMELVDGPLASQGVLILNEADGSFVFTPNDHFFGDVTFTYRLYDGHEYCAPVTVTIHVVIYQIFLPVTVKP